jgi:hypothetical protein
MCLCDQKISDTHATKLSNQNGGRSNRNQIVIQYFQFESSHKIDQKKNEDQIQFPN